MLIKRINSFYSFLKNVQNVITFMSYFCNNCEILNLSKIFHTFIKTSYEIWMSNHKRLLNTYVQLVITVQRVKDSSTRFENDELARRNNMLHSFTKIGSRPYIQNRWNVCYYSKTGTSWQGARMNSAVLHGLSHSFYDSLTFMTSSFEWLALSFLPAFS